MKTKNEAKSLSRTIQPCGSLRDFEIDRSGGSRKQPSWLTALFAPSMARRPASTINLKTDLTLVEQEQKQKQEHYFLNSRS